MNLATFFTGITCATFFFAGVFFLKFWRASRDPFFRYFCIACWLLSIERIVTLQYSPALPNQPAEMPGVTFYLFRLSAFVLIFVAVLQKNKKSQRPKSDTRA